jgi:hypothetical protein
MSRGGDRILCYCVIPGKDAKRASEIIHPAFWTDC